MSTAKTFGATYTYVFNAKLVKLYEKLQKIVLYHNCTVQKYSPQVVGMQQMFRIVISDNV